MTHAKQGDSDLGWYRWPDPHALEAPREVPVGGEVFVGDAKGGPEVAECQGGLDGVRLQIGMQHLDQFIVRRRVIGDAQFPVRRHPGQD